MSTIVWDEIGSKIYETGISKAVIYTNSGVVVPWSGLTSIQENTTQQSTPIYFDGRKIYDQVTLGEYSATVKAITYPDELTELQGYGSIRNGIFIADQLSTVFNLSYQTLIGDDLIGQVGYKIHIIYNVTATMKAPSYSTVSESINFSQFEWNLTAVPEDLEFYRPTAHIIIDSTKVSSTLLQQIEGMLYGTSIVSANLLSMSKLIESLGELISISIVDNNDGTFTASSTTDALIVHGTGALDSTAVISDANTRVIDVNTYELSNTLYDTELSDITFVNNNNGTWTATTVDTSLITISPTNVFVIKNSNAFFLNPSTWRITYT